MSLKYLLLIIILGTFYTHQTKAGSAHNHGQAHMSIVLDQQELVVHANLAAFDLIGFEHYPKSESELQQIETMLKKLTSVKDWFLINKGACLFQKLNTVNPFSKEHIHADHSNHLDFELTVSYECQKPHELVELKILLMKTFPKILQVEIQWLVHNKQGITDLDANNTMLRFQ